MDGDWSMGLVLPTRFEDDLRNVRCVLTDRHRVPVGIASSVRHIGAPYLLGSIRGGTCRHCGFRLATTPWRVGERIAAITLGTPATSPVT